MNFVIFSIRTRISETKPNEHHNFAWTNLNHVIRKSHADLSSMYVVQTNVSEWQARSMRIQMPCGVKLVRQQFVWWITHTDESGEQPGSLNSATESCSDDQIIHLSAARSLAASILFCHAMRPANCLGDHKLMKWNNHTHMRWVRSGGQLLIWDACGQHRWFEWPGMSRNGQAWQRIHRGLPRSVGGAL